MKVFNEYVAIFSNENDYAATLSTSSPPCLPSVLMMISTMERINTSPDVSDDGTINLQKGLMYTEAVDMFVLYHVSTYNFHKVDVIYNFFREPAYMDDERVKCLSLEIQSKGKKKK